MKIKIKDCIVKKQKAILSAGVGNLKSLDFTCSRFEVSCRGQTSDYGITSNNFMVDVKDNDIASKIFVADLGCILKGFPLNEMIKEVTLECLKVGLYFIFVFPYFF